MRPASTCTPHRVSASIVVLCATSIQEVECFSLQAHSYLMACPIIFPRNTNISTWAGDVAPGLGTYRSRPTPAAWTPFGVRISSGRAVDCTRVGQEETTNAFVSRERNSGER